jgi:hypothetical protein
MKKGASLLLGVRALLTSLTSFSGIPGPWESVGQNRHGVGGEGDSGTLLTRFSEKISRPGVRSCIAIFPAPGPG